MIILLLILLAIIIQHQKETFISDLINKGEEYIDKSQKFLDETPIVKDNVNFVINEATSLSASVGPQNLNEAIKTKNKICNEYKKIDDSFINQFEKNRLLEQCNQAILDVHNFQSPQRHKAVFDAKRLCAITIDTESKEKCKKATDLVKQFGGFLTFDEFKNRNNVINF